MIVRLADEQDAPGLVELARQVEDWFAPAEAAAPGPEGGSRQVYRKTIADKHARQPESLARVVPVRLSQAGCGYDSGDTA